MRPSHLAALLGALALTRADGTRAQPRDLGAAPSTDAVRLRLHHRAGSTARFVARTAHTAGPPEATTRSTTTATITVETRAVGPGGEARQRMRIERMAVEGAGMPPGLRARVARALTGAAFEYTQSDRGEVSARELATEVPDELRPILDATMQSLDHLDAQLPERPVRLGERWTERRTLHLAPLPGTRVAMRYETEYTLRALRPDGAAVLALAVRLATPEGATLAGIPFHGEGHAAGESVVDLARGVVRESRTAGQLSVRLSVRGRTVDVPSRFESEMRLLSSRLR